MPFIKQIYEDTKKEGSLARDVLEFVVTETEYPRKTHLKENRFILAHNIKDFNPMPAGTITMASSKHTVAGIYELHKMGAGIWPS